MLKAIGAVYEKNSYSSLKKAKEVGFYFYPVNTLGKNLNLKKSKLDDKNHSYYDYYCQSSGKIYISKTNLKYKILDLDSNLDFKRSFLNYISQKIAENQQFLPTIKDNFVMTMDVLDFRNNIKKLYFNVQKLTEINNLLEFQPELSDITVDYDVLFPMVTVELRIGKDIFYSVGPNKEFCLEMLYLRHNTSAKNVRKHIEKELKNQFYQYEFQTLLYLIDKRCSLKQTIDYHSVKKINGQIKNVI